MSPQSQYLKNVHSDDIQSTGLPMERCQLMTCVSPHWWREGTKNLHARVFSCVWFFTTPWTVACHVPLTMGYSRQDYWNGLPSPPPGDLPDSGIKPASLMSPALAGGFFTTGATWEVQKPTWQRWKCWATGHQSQGPGPCDRGKLIPLSPQERLSTSQVNQLSNLAFYSITCESPQSQSLAPARRRSVSSLDGREVWGENGYMCTCGWVLLLSMWEDHNTVNQLDSDIKSIR